MNMISAKTFRSYGILFLFCISLLPASVNGNPVGKWDYFKFKPGQYFKYDINSDRGLKGWVSIGVKKGDGSALNITISGEWTGKFSETIRYTPGMMPMDFIYSAENFEIPNAAGSLLNIDEFITGHAVWKEGFNFSQSGNEIKISGTREAAGIKGMLLSYTSKHFATKKTETRIYCVNTSLPLPVYVKAPAANDTWTYELKELKK